MKTKKLKKHTPVGDVGFGTKKEALADLKFSNKTFDVLNEGFTDDLYEGIDELEDF